MKRPWLSFAVLLLTSGPVIGATIVHRYSFDGNTNDSVSGNHGVLNGATVSSTHLVLPGTGTGPAAASMGFSSIVGIGANFGTTGVTIELRDTDNNSGTWAKLFTFGTSVAGQEVAFTNIRGGGDLAPGVDRNGNHFLSGYPAGSNTRIPTGVEHHLVLTVAADGITDLWIDGTQQITAVATNPLSSVVSSTELIGATAWNDPGHTGSVNEFRIWSGTFTSGDVATSLALGPNVIPEPVAVSLAGFAALGVLVRRRRRR